MNPSQDHEQWADYLDPEASDPDLSPAERAGLDQVAERLRDQALWDGPPPQLRAALLDRAAAEVASTRAAPELPAVPPSEPADRRGGARPSRWAGPMSRWLVAASAVAVVALTGALLWPRDHPASFPIAGTALAPQASAVVELTPKSAGVAIRLKITGLKPAPPGAFYAAWLRGPAGVVPVGTFHWHKGGIPIDLWSGVGSDRYPELFVTLQREGSPPSPSDQVVLTGRSP